MVAQLAGVAVPVIALQDAPCIGRQAFDLFAQFGVGLRQEALRQEHQVFLALAQRRDADGILGQTVVQVFAKLTPLHHGQQVGVGRRDDAKVNLLLARAANAVNAPRLQSPQQFALQRQRQVADFVEEDGAAVGLLEGAGLGLVCAREGAFFMAKQLAFDQRLGDGTAIDRDQRLFGAQTQGVDRLRHQFLAGAGFTRDQNREVGSRHQFDFALDALDAGAVAHRVQQEVGLAWRVDDATDLRLGGFFCQRAMHGVQNVLVLERLGDVVPGAGANRARGVVGFAVARDHDDRNRLVEQFDAREHLKAVHVGQTDVEQNHIGCMACDAGKCVLAVGGRQRCEAGLAHDVGQDPACVFLVVHDQYLDRCAAGAVRDNFWQACFGHGDVFVHAGISGCPLRLGRRFLTRMSGLSKGSMPWASPKNSKPISLVNKV